MNVEFLPCGDSAFAVQFGDRVDRMLSRRVMGLHAALRARPLPGVVETVPTFRSLLVHYDPRRTSQKALRDLIHPIATVDMTIESHGRHFKIPVCYDTQLAFDLLDVAANLGMKPEEVVRIHSETEHYVYMIGFAPGHPYIGDLPQSLVLPRREDPRPRVEVGTIAIAVGMTVIYPFDNPCGWHVIGRTPLRLFDLRRSPPNVLAAGDMVEFNPISIAEFDRLDAANDPQARSEGQVLS